MTFSCKTRGFCPSSHAKRLEERGEWVRETLLLDVPHRQVVFVIPRMLRVFFKFKLKLLGELLSQSSRVDVHGREFAIEPSFYYPEKNIGLCIEDTVLITKDG